MNTHRIEKAEVFAQPKIAPHRVDADTPAFAKAQAKDAPTPGKVAVHLFWCAAIVVTIVQEQLEKFAGTRFGCFAMALGLLGMYGLMMAAAFYSLLITPPRF